MSAGERIRDRAVLDREGVQLLEQPAFLGLESRARVVGHQAGQSLVPMVAEELGAVEGMKAQPVQRWRIADVMQVGGGHQHVTILVREVKVRADAAGLVGDRLDVPPAVTQGGHQGLGLRLGPWFQRHGATIPWRLDRAQVVLLAASMLVKDRVMLDRGTLGEPL
jgi:hypothetical protein